MKEKLSTYWLFSLFFILLFSFCPISSNSSTTTTTKNEIHFKTDFEPRNNILQKTMGYIVSDYITMSSSDTSVYGQFNIYGNLISGQKNSLTIQFNPTSFSSSISSGKLVNSKAVGLVSISATYFDIKQHGNIDYNFQSTFQLASNTTYISRGQSINITVNNIDISSDAEQLSFDFSIKGMILQELANNPSNTSVVDASANGNSYTFDVHPPPSQIDWILIFLIVVLIVVVGTTSYKKVSKKGKNTDSETNSTIMSAVLPNEEPPSNPASGQLNNQQIYPKNRNYTLCSNCGQPLQFDDLFCSNCGEQRIKK